ncbi:MAG: endonuclease/exonuclease/phosphatase family protein [Vicinamibacterales bacterium]
MRRDLRPLVTAILVALLCGSVHLAGCEVAPPPAAAAATDRSLRVMTFNIRHGMDGRGRYNLQRAVDVIARVQPDLVGLQEITRNHSMYKCDDQPAKMPRRLRLLHAGRPSRSIAASFASGIDSAAILMPVVPR